MRATDLIKNAMAFHNAEGASESIKYNHKDGTFDEVYCFAAGREYTDQKRGIRKHETVFSQVFLSQSPTDDDTIDYDGETYRVMRWEKQLGQYIIYAERMSRHTGRRSRHSLSGRGSA